ncbi:MAG: hypothetical protein K9G49_09020 [Taibaiella sp.]|nr:hypothetical protein [Taibaiella sp.]
MAPPISTFGSEKIEEVDISLKRCVFRGRYRQHKLYLQVKLLIITNFWDLDGSEKMRKGAIALALRTLSHFVDSPDKLSNRMMDFFRLIYNLRSVL